MASTKPHQYSCIGTNRITITEDDQSSTDGMLSLFRQDNVVYNDEAVRPLSDGDDDSEECLHLVITDGVDTFYARMAAKEIKQMSHEDGLSPLDQVADVLLYRKELVGMEHHTKQENYKIYYKRIEGQLLGGDHDSTNTTSVDASILKTCYNNLVRPVWKSLMINVQHAKYENLPYLVQNALPEPSDEATSTFSSSGLAFSLMLGNNISKLKDEADSLRKQNERLTKDTLRWKGTLDKVMGQWQLEKNELTQNFLILFNQHKARHLETRQQLEALKRNTGDKAVIGRLKNEEMLKNEREAVPDDEDNQDNAIWDDEMVDRLAAGPEGRKNMTKQQVKIDDFADIKIQSSSSDKFFNPVTGVMMLTDHKRLFDSESDQEDAVSSKKRKGGGKSE